MKRIFSVIIIIIILSAPLPSCGKMPGNNTSGETPSFTADFLSTGKSDCILVRMDGYVMLNDAADEDDYGLIKETLGSYGITEINCFVISHYDNDHIGSAADVISDYKVDLVVAPDITADTNLYKKLMNAVNETGTKLKFLNEDYSFEAGTGRVWINAPEKESYDDVNNYSLITSVYYGNYSLLLAGDALKERMEEFNSACTSTYTLIKLPHHGSYNKGLRVFLSNAMPKYAVLTSVKDSFIDNDLASKLQTLGTALYSTADGGVHVEIANGKFNISYNK